MPDQISIETQSGLQQFSLLLFTDAQPETVAATVVVTESVTRPGYYVGAVSGGLVGWFDVVGMFNGFKRVDGRVKLANDNGLYRVGRDPTVAQQIQEASKVGAKAAAVEFFETENRIPGGVSYLETFVLVAAGVVGTSTSSGNTETFRDLAGNDAFTTTFATNGNRQTLQIH